MTSPLPGPLQDTLTSFLALVPGAREHVLPEPSDWLRLWAAGDPALSLLDLDEDGLTKERLEEHGWPARPGIALVEYVPVLPVAGELDASEAEALWTDAWESPLHGALSSLPASRHLVSAASGLSGTRWDLGEARLFEAEFSDDDATVRATFCFAVQRHEDRVLGLVLGGRKARATLTRCLGRPRLPQGLPFHVSRPF